MLTKIKAALGWGTRKGGAMSQELARKNLSDTERATVLATLAMARQQLGQPYRELLEQARALDPDADLVAEAIEKAAVTATDSPARAR